MVAIVGGGRLMKLLTVIAASVLWFCVSANCAHAQMVAAPCGVPMVPGPVATALSSMCPSGPIIVFNPQFFQQLGIYGPPMFRYMQAHECAHHMNGDVVAGAMDPQGMLMINPQIELRADCTAARILKAAGDLQALQIAINFWAQSGNMPTGPNYPTGNQRAQMLSSC